MDIASLLERNGIKMNQIHYDIYTKFVKYTMLNNYQIAAH